MCKMRVKAKVDPSLPSFPHACYHLPLFHSGTELSLFKNCGKEVLWSHFGEILFFSTLDVAFSTFGTNLLVSYCCEWLVEKDLGKILDITHCIFIPLILIV
jgi:hypothetical protein